jgi:ubiquinone/menaquinone biosynthesis C-methylase UbiE
MDTLQESVVHALDGEEAGLYPYLPYLLQDLWALGSSPDVMVDLVRSHRLHERGEPLRVLDLGCGKGAVAVALARAFGCVVHGVDGMPAFVAEARRKAREAGVGAHCTFEVGDLRDVVRRAAGYDLVVLGALGPVLGEVGATLRALDPCLSPGGHVLLDDAYVPDAGQPAPGYLPEPAFREQIERSGFAVVAEVVADAAEMEDDDAGEYAAIERRVRDLSARHPDQRPLFEGYLARQRDEYRFLEQRARCVTLLLGRRQG